MLLTLIIFLFFWFCFLPLFPHKTVFSLGLLNPENQGCVFLISKAQFLVKNRTGSNSITSDLLTSSFLGSKCCTKKQLLDGDKSLARWLCWSDMLGAGNDVVQRLNMSCLLCFNIITAVITNRNIVTTFFTSYFSVLVYFLLLLFIGSCRTGKGMFYHHQVEWSGRLLSHWILLVFCKRTEEEVGAVTIPASLRDHRNSASRLKPRE